MADYPNSNGTAHDWSSVEVDLGEDGGIFTGISELTYSDNLEPGEAMGTSAQKLARTRGVYSAEGSITMLKRDATEFIAALGNGFKEKTFDITVMYSDTNVPDVITDKLFSCRIGSTESGGSQGSDALSVTYSIDIMRISWNGVDPLADMLK